MKISFILASSLLFISCSVHKKSNIDAKETFVVTVEKPVSRGGAIELGIQGLLLGANYLAEKSAKSLVNVYDETIAVNNYYEKTNGIVDKAFNKIHIQRYSKPLTSENDLKAKSILNDELASQQKTRGSAFTTREMIRKEQEDLLNFDAIIEILSDDENIGVSRLSFKEMRVFFSKTKVFEDENLNVKVSVSIEGEWRSSDGSPMSKLLVEQEYDFKKIKYGIENQISSPILSPWYYDIPIYSDIENESKFGILKIKIRMEEYEGSKSKYIEKIPSILSENKNSIIKSGSSTISKMIK